MLFAVGAPISTQQFMEHVLPTLWERFVDIVTAPFSIPQMLWITLPLLLTLLVMEFYFGRYRKEQLGWNSAVGNTLVLVFVSLDLLRQIYGPGGAPIMETLSLNAGKTLLASAIGLSGLLIMYFDFFHLIPKRLAFRISSSLPVNLTAYTAIAIVYAGIPIDFFTVSATFLLFIITTTLFTLIHIIEPKYLRGDNRTKVQRVTGQIFKSPEETAEEESKPKKKKLKEQVSESTLDLIKKSINDPGRKNKQISPPQKKKP
jgi:hypothetical protein